jgi:transcriptional regulator with XRE-family HTH domain
MSGDGCNADHSGSEGELERDNGFHDRLRAILKNEASSSAFARRAGISQSGFHRIEHGGEPTLKTIIAIANAAGVTVQWLATGHDAGDSKHLSGGSGAMDKWLFSRVIDGIRRTYEKVGGRLQTVNEVELGLEMYHRIAAVAETQDERRGALLMALDQLERELLEKGRRPASGKQSA